MGVFNNDDRAVWYGVLAGAALLIALAGYVGYVLYPRFDLPAASGVGLFVLAAAAGIGSFFSPCSFPLLVGLLGRATRAGEEESAPSLRRALRFATALSVGASLFLLLTGAGIAAGGAPLFEQVTFTSTAGRIIRVGVGALLVLLGLVQLGVVPMGFDLVAAAVDPLMRRQAHLRRKRPTLGFALLGFGYILAGFG